MATRTKKEETVTQQETVKKPSQSTRLREIKKNMKNIDVEVQNLSQGNFVYAKGSDILEINERGETKIVSLDLLSAMSKSFLEKFFIAIVDVYDDYDKDDVLKVLGIEDEYSKFDISVEGVESFLDDKTSVDDFDKTLNSLSDNLVYRIAERAVILDKNKQFDSYAKRKSLETRLQNPYLFGAV